jgi:peptide/nickel transport system permease protein
LVGVTLGGPEGQRGLWVRQVTRRPVGGIEIDESTAHPVRLLVHGPAWTWLGGLVTGGLRFFGVDGPVRFHLMGTDEQGRDLFSRVVYGAWISLFIGLISIAIGMGVPVGAISGFLGGTTDLIVQRLIDTLLAFPGILLAIVLVTTFGTGLTNVMIAVGIASVPIYARLVRGSVLAPIIVQSSLQMAVAILFAAGLGFLGLGARPPQPEWGLMLAGGRE